MRFRTRHVSLPPEVAALPSNVLSFDLSAEYRKGPICIFLFLRFTQEFTVKDCDFLSLVFAQFSTNHVCKIPHILPWRCLLEILGSFSNVDTKTRKHPKRPTTIHNHPQRTQNDPQRPTTNQNIPKRPKTPLTVFKH